MPKFRKRTPVVDAVQWDGTHAAAIAIGLESWTSARRKYGIDHPDAGYWVDVVAGDWIITRANGSQIPCKPDTFEATYEPVEDPPRS